MQNLMARLEEQNKPSVFGVDELAATHAEAVLGAFRAWRAVAAPDCDHLEVLRPAA